MTFQRWAAVVTLVAVALIFLVGGTTGLAAGGSSSGQTSCQGTATNGLATLHLTPSVIAAHGGKNAASVVTGELQALCTAGKTPPEAAAQTLKDFA